MLAAISRKCHHARCLTTLALIVAACCCEAGPEPSERKPTASLEVFEHRVVLSKALGATHVVITDDIPPASWQFDAPDDPYPAWFIYRPRLLKIFPPKEVQPCVDMRYARRLQKIFEDRCAILREYGLKAQWDSSEPQVMPEAFLTAYPQLHRPRVDRRRTVPVAGIVVPNMRAAGGDRGDGAPDACFQSWQ